MKWSFKFKSFKIKIKTIIMIVGVIFDGGNYF